VSRRCRPPAGPGNSQACRVDQIDRATRALRACDESEEFADLAAEIRREITVKIVPTAMALICLSDGGAASGCRGKKSLADGAARVISGSWSPELCPSGALARRLGQPDADTFLDKVAVRRVT